MAKWSTDSMWARTPWTGATPDTDDDVPGAPRRPAAIVIGASHLLKARHLVVPAEENLVVGRTPEGEGPRLVLDEDRLVSRMHARVVPSENAFEVHDLGSGNGTFVNTCPIPTRGPAPNGSLVFVGRHALMLRFLSDQARAAIAQDWKRPFMSTPTLSPQVALLHKRLRMRLDDQRPVLLCGPPGVGKLSYAATIHEKTSSGGPMRTIDGTSLALDPRGQVVVHPADEESPTEPSKLPAIDELIREAQGGTLYLNRVDRAAPAVQGAVAALVRQGLGDVRLIVSSLGGADQGENSGHALLPHLADAILSGGLAFTLPSLVRRKEDIATIFRHTMGNRSGVTVSLAAWRALLLYDWPGNVEQLRSTARRLLFERLSGSPQQIELTDLPEAMRVTCGAWIRDAREVPPEASDEQITISDPAEVMWQRAARRRISFETAAAEVGSTHGWTPRQIEIVAWLAKGWSPKETGVKFGISHKTVYAHLSQMAEKMRLTDPDEVVRMVTERVEKAANTW